MLQIPEVYTSSDGKQTPISELNNFHLVNALIKQAIQSDAGDAGAAAMTSALKAEVLKRLAPKLELPK